MPRLHRRHGHERMLDRIARKDRDGTPGLETEVGGPFGRRTAPALGPAIGDFSPLPRLACALREPDALWRLIGPFRQRSWDMRVIGFQRNARLQDDDAVIAPLDHDVAREPIDLSKGRLVQRGGGIPLHIASPEISPVVRISFVVIAGYRSAFICREKSRCLIMSSWRK